MCYNTVMKKYLAEGIGTFTLTAAVLIILGSPLAGSTPIVAGLTVGLFVYTVGSISGAQFNPAITLGIWSIKKISTATAALYIVMQIVGTLLARWFVMSLYPTTALVVTNSWPTFAAEAIGTAILAFGVAAVVFNRVNQTASGLTIGGSLILGIWLTIGLSNGVLNPAVALGIGSLSWVYVVAPICGSLLAFQLYRRLQK